MQRSPATDHEVTKAESSDDMLIGRLPKVYVLCVRGLISDLEGKPYGPSLAHDARTKYPALTITSQLGMSS